MILEMMANIIPELAVTITETTKLMSTQPAHSNLLRDLQTYEFNLKQTNKKKNNVHKRKLQ